MEASGPGVEASGVEPSESGVVTIPAMAMFCVTAGAPPRVTTVMPSCVTAKAREEAASKLTATGR